jgi:hypothetical protein
MRIGTIIKFFVPQIRDCLIHVKGRNVGEIATAFFPKRVLRIMDLERHTLAIGKFNIHAFHAMIIRELLYDPVAAVQFRGLFSLCFFHARLPLPNLARQAFIVTQLLPKPAA